MVWLKVIYFGVFVREKAGSDDGENGQPVGTVQTNWETRVDDQESVAVAVTPLLIDLSSRATEWKFDVSMNTHSVELNQDMMKSAVLFDDQGNEYPVLKWEGSEPGGHHREGILIFDPVKPSPLSITLLLKSIGGVPERSFTWNLK